MSLNNSNKEDSDHLSKIQEQNGKNKKIQQKKLKIAEKEKASRPKKVYKGNTSAWLFIIRVYKL